MVLSLQKIHAVYLSQANRGVRTSYCREAAIRRPPQNVHAVYSPQANRGVRMSYCREAAKDVPKDAKFTKKSAISRGNSALNVRNETQIRAFFGRFL